MTDVFYPDLGGNGKGVLDLGVAPAETLVVSNGLIAYGSREALRAAPQAGTVLLTGSTILADPGLFGNFTWIPGNQAALVALDPGEGFYIAPINDLSGTSGAWRRVISYPTNPKWFNAVGDGIANDQTALQRMINTCFAFFDAITFDFPIGVYNIGGTEDPTTHGMLYYPFNNSGPIKHVRLIGRGRPATPAFGVTTNGVVIQSSVAGANIDSAILSAHAYNATRDNSLSNRVYPHFENVTFRTTNNPTRGGLQFSNCLCFSAKNVNVDTGTAILSLSQPTSNVCGIWMPLVDNYGFIIAHDTFVSGFPTGMKVSEHADLKCYFFRCATAIEFEMGFHLNFGYIEVEHCPIVVKASGISTVRLDLNLERYDVPDSGADAWYKAVGTDVHETTADLLKGSINYKLALANVGDIFPPRPLTSNTGRLLSLVDLSRPFLGASVFSNAAQTLANNTLTAIGFAAENYDMIGGGGTTATFHNSTASGRFTFDRSGIADIVAVGVFAINTVGLRQMILRKNGTTVLDSRWYTPVAGQVTTCPIQGRYEVVAGDYIEIMALQTSTGNLDLVITGDSPSRATLAFNPYS